MRNVRPGRCSALVVLGVLLAGCYVPAPADPVSLAPGEDVRVVLTTEARQRQDGTTGAGSDGELRGRVLRISDDSLAIAVPLPRSATAGLAATDVRRPVTLARADIREITVPRLDRGRTGVLIGVAVVALAVVIGDLFDLRGDADSRQPPNPPDPGAPFTGRR